MADQILPMIFIKRFWTEYKPDPANPEKMREVDMVEYAPVGSAKYTMITESISRLSSLIPLEGRHEHNPAVVMAHARWNAIQPKYEAWKKGQSAPVSGTPLAAWSGVSPQQAEILRMHGILTVEEVSKMTDTHRQRIGLPGLLDLTENAKRYLTALDKNAVTKALEEKDAKMAQMQAQIEELMAMVKEAKEAEPVKRGPGRPPKVPVEAVA